MSDSMTKKSDSFFGEKWPFACGGVKESDALTGLPSISEFYRLAEEAVAIPELAGVQLNIVYFNIENIKLYNERFGFAAGDELLVFTARIIENSFERALVSHVADDRFVLLTYGDDLEDGLSRVHQAVITHNKSQLTVIRAGVFVYDGESEISLACDRAKLACDYIRGRYDVYWHQYDESLLEKRDSKFFIIGRFENALREGHIQVYYQPIFRVIGSRVTEFEALARWIDPEVGFISPADFIPVLEESRLIHVLDLHVIETVCRQFSYILENGYPVAAANVNISRLDMELCDIVEETRKLIARYNIPPSTVNIEVTESTFGESSELLRTTIDRFHDLGMQVWMDDFGSGYSSLNVLREYPFDVVKIDMSFLRHSNEDSREKSRSMLPHVISMMKDLGFQTLAEGVETQEQLDFLREIGCEKVQGFLFAKPAPIEALTGRIASGEFGVEPQSQKDYMDVVGRVDLAYPATIDSQLGDSLNLSNGLAAAIVEFHDNAVRYLAWNDSYIDYLRDIGMNTIENSTKQMNDLTRLQSKGFFAAASKMKGVPKWVNLSFYEGDDLCTGRARCIAFDDECDTCAYVYIAFNVSRFLEQSGQTQTLPKLQ